MRWTFTLINRLRSRWWCWIIGAALAPLLFGWLLIPLCCWCWTSWTGEPTYQQHRLRWWVYHAARAGAPVSEQKRAEAAVRRMGSNAVPYLLALGLKTDSPFKNPWKSQLNDWVWMRGHIHIWTLYDDPQAIAYWGFEYISIQDKRWAYPVLTNRLNDRSYGVRMNALGCLESFYDDRKLYRKALEIAVGCPYRDVSESARKRLLYMNQADPILF
jgi:hypothetical protein